MEAVERLVIVLMETPDQTEAQEAIRTATVERLYK